MASRKVLCKSLTTIPISLRAIIPRICSQGMRGTPATAKCHLSASDTLNTLPQPRFGSRDVSSYLQNSTWGADCRFQKARCTFNCHHGNRGSRFSHPVTCRKLLLVIWKWTREMVIGLSRRGKFYAVGSRRFHECSNGLWPRGRTRLTYFSLKVKDSVRPSEICRSPTMQLFRGVGLPCARTEDIGFLSGESPVLFA